MAATPPRASAVERKLQRHTEEVVAVMTNSQAPPAPTRRASMEPKEERKKKKGSSSIGPRPRRAKSTAKEPADPTVSCGCPLDDDDDITPGDPWAAMRERTFLSGDTKAKLTGMVRKVSKATLLLGTLNNSIAFDELIKRRGMTRKLMDELRSSGWDLRIPMLDSLGLMDKETVQNMTRSFRGQDALPIRRTPSRSLSPVRTTESDRCQDASSEEPRRQPSDPAEYLSCDASPEQSEMSQRRSRWQGCRRFSRSWNTGSSFFGSSMRFTFENDCPHDDVPKLLRSTASDPLPSDGDEALLAKDIKNRPRSRAEPLRSDVTELRPHSLEPLPAARDESHPVKIVRKRTNTPLVPAARPDTSLTPERLPQGTKRKISPLTITPDKIPPLMLKKTNETQVAKAVMDLTYDDEHSGATEKVFCEMIDKRHLQIQKFSSKEINGNDRVIVLFERHLEELEVDLLRNRARQPDAIKVIIYESLGKNLKVKKVSKKFTQLFAELDMNNDGVISAAELKPLAEKMANEKGISQTDLKRLFEHIDANHNGEISKEEFEAFLSQDQKARTIFLHSPDADLVRKWYGVITAAKQ